MASQFLDLAGLTHYDGKLKAVAAGAISITGRTIKLNAVSGVELGSVTVPETTYNLASGTSDGLMSAAHFTKVEGISEGANKVESSTTNGNIKIDGLETKVYTHTTGVELAAGMYTISTDAEGHVKTGAKVTKADITALGIPAQDTTYEEATAVKAGLMSAADKSKLDDISEGATAVTASGTNGHINIDGQDVVVYKHAAHTAAENGLYKVTVDGEGHVSAVVAVAKSDIVGLGIPAQDTTYDLASADADGLMSSAQFTKLEGVAEGAQVNVIEKVSVNGSALPINSKGVNIDLSAYALKSDITSVYRYKGSVATYAELPAEGLTVGDVYNVETADAAHGVRAGDNLAWNGEAWDNLAGIFTMDSIPTSDIDALFA